MPYVPGGNKKSSAPKGGNMERPPFGTRSPCVLAAYYPAGTHEVIEYITGKKKLQDKMVLVWEIDLSDSKGRQFRVFETLTDSLYASAVLKQRAEALMGRSMTKKESEGDGFNMDSLLGLCAMMRMTDEDPEKPGKGPYIDKIDELQDKDVRVAIRNEYDVLPRYVKTVLDSAEEGTVPGCFGAMIDGEVFFGNLPTKEEEVPEDNDSNGGGGKPPF